MTIHDAGIRRLAGAACAVAAVLAGAAAARANDWPQFRGPTGQGHAPAAAVPLTWSETENVTWKTPVPGLGWSSPVVADGRLWLTTALIDTDEGSSLRLLAFDAETGDPALDVEVFDSSEVYSLNPKNSLASPTPVLDPGGSGSTSTSGPPGPRPSAPTASSCGAPAFPTFRSTATGGRPSCTTAG